MSRRLLEIPKETFGDPFLPGSIPAQPSRAAWCSEGTSWAPGCASKMPPQPGQHSHT